MHLSFALFRQRATAAALYAPLTELMQALGLKRLSYGVTVDKTYANGELTHEGKGIHRPALEAGLADGSIVSFNLGKGQLMSAPDMVVAQVNDARHGSADVQVHVPLACLGLNALGQPLPEADAALVERRQRVQQLLNEVLLLAQPECGWQHISPNAARGMTHAQGSGSLLPHETGCNSAYWAQQPWTQPRMLFPLNWLSPAMLAALPSPQASQQATMQATPNPPLTLGQRLQALLGADALQAISPTLTRVAVPADQLNAINDSLGREGRLACWRACNRKSCCPR